MNRVIFVALVGAAVLCAAPAGPAQPAPSPRADALELLFIGGETPARLELRAEIDGRPVPAVWDDTFAKLFAYFDRDADGALDATEAARLPSAFALRQVLWGQSTPFTGAAPPLADIDLNGDGKASPDEVADFYRRAGLGGVLVGCGKAPATDALTDALLKHLDTNKDGKLTEAEVKTAPDALKALDANDDELIGPGELVERTAYPGALGSILVTAPAPNGAPDAVADALPFVVLPLRTADRGWEAVAAARRAAAKRPAFAGDALRGARADAPAVAWRVRFGAGKLAGGAVAAADGKPPASGQLVYAAGAVRLELRSDEGKLAEPVAAARKRYAAQFAEADADANARLDPKELAAPKAGTLKQLAAAADRNGDGALSDTELTAWLDLQDQIARGHVLLTVIDHGAGLFELLDADHDGALSVRELRGAWDRLTAAGCVTDGRFDRAKLPRQLLAAISRGHPKSSPGKPARPGPAWFVAMDRNGDGDVSRREFTGPAAVFDTLDADKDGLLDAREAGAAAKK
ncbi:EF-hand domain-containing protein [Gemmata sp. JC717]|uniref:EF-hand domain-containing protein n=1 Tax=Gemmata algarum TaxID=2975278 RepID=UPI0021BA643C|nr:EF-hand domain-containing protein [Gemmata algarum]MDY3552730.1 EF-hand domain-containing protein [Gemmata algarum]